MDKTQILVPKDNDKTDDREKTKVTADFFPDEYETSGKKITSGKLKTIFPGKTEEEFAVINRKFLRDAEPFSLKKLIQEQKKKMPSIFTGYPSLDQKIQIPSHGVFAIFGPPKSFKSLFLLNLLANIAVRYRDKHFLLYSYQESREDIETKMINMLGNIPFSAATAEGDLPRQKQGASEADAMAKEGSLELSINLQVWQNMLRSVPEEKLLGLAESNNEFKGLKNFLLISQRIHIIPTNYTLEELLESTKLFGNQFGLGGIFIDSLDKIGLRAKNDHALDKIALRSDLLNAAGRELGLPIITTVQYSGSDKLKNMFSLSEPGREELLKTVNNFGLIAGIEKTVKQVKGGNSLELNIIGNRNGPCMSLNLSFDPQLLKIKEAKS